jgi:NAD-dependent SIR2 family protein deacetylase
VLVLGYASNDVVNELNPTLPQVYRENGKVLKDMEGLFSYRQFMGNTTQYARVWKYVQSLYHVRHNDEPAPFVHRLLNRVLRGRLLHHVITFNLDELEYKEADQMKQRSIQVDPAHYLYRDTSSGHRVLRMHGDVSTAVCTACHEGLTLDTNRLALLASGMRIECPGADCKRRGYTDCAMRPSISFNDADPLRNELRGEGDQQLKAALGIDNSRGEKPKLIIVVGLSLKHNTDFANKLLEAGKKAKIIFINKHDESAFKRFSFPHQVFQIDAEEWAERLVNYLT